MAEGSGTANTAEGSGAMADSTIEIKVKTLESNTFVLQVDKNIPVPALKELIAAESGVPVENQRLICRGRVLKDNEPLSAYNMESGHTLHLVSRHPPSEARGRAPGARPPQGPSQQDGPRRIQQVVMGSIDMTDMADGMDATRLMSHILNSIGIASAIAQAAGGTNQESGLSGNGGQRPVQGPGEQAGGTGPTRGGEGVTQPPPLSQGLPAGIEVRIEQSFVPSPPPGQGGNTGLWLQQIPYPPVVPDALTTSAQVLGRLANTFLEYEAQTEPLLAATAHFAAVLPGSQAPNQTSTSGAQAAAVATPAAPGPHGAAASGASRPAAADGQGAGIAPGAPGPVGGSRNGTLGREGRSAAPADALRTSPNVPRPEHLASLVLLTHNLLATRVVPSLTRLTQILAREPRMTDPSHRAMSQAAAFRDGALIQQLGSYLLELGRCIQTIRFGGSPAESFVNAGPPVFITPLGTVNLMVQQPVPYQPPSVSIPVGVHNHQGGGFVPQHAPGHMAFNLGTGQIVIPVNLNANAPPRTSSGEPTPPHLPSGARPQPPPAAAHQGASFLPRSSPPDSSSSPSPAAVSTGPEAAGQGPPTASGLRAEAGASGNGEATAPGGGQAQAGQGGARLQQPNNPGGVRQGTVLLGMDGMNLHRLLTGGGGSTGDVLPSGAGVHGMPGIMGGVGIPGMSMQHTTILFGGGQETQNAASADLTGSVAGTPGRQWGSALQSGFLNRRTTPPEMGGQGPDAPGQAAAGAGAGGSAGGQRQFPIDSASHGQIDQNVATEGATGGAASGAPPEGSSPAAASAPLGLGMGSSFEFPRRRRPRSQPADTSAGAPDSGRENNESSTMPEGPEQAFQMLASAIGSALQPTQGASEFPSDAASAQTDGGPNAGPGVTVFTSIDGAPDMSSFNAVLQHMLQSQQAMGGVARPPAAEGGAQGEGPSASGHDAPGLSFTHFVSQMAPIMSQVFGAMENPLQGGAGGRAGQDDGARPRESRQDHGAGNSGGASAPQPPEISQGDQVKEAKRQRMDEDGTAAEGNRAEGGSSPQADVEGENAGHDNQTRQA